MKKVVIIGAGPAGITAGLELKRRNREIDVTVLEESSMIGGISRTVNCNGNRMDMGGHRFFSKDEQVNAWWESILKNQGKPSVDDIITKTEKELSGNGDPETEDDVFLKRRRVSRIYYDGKFFDYPISMKLQTFKNMGLGKTVKSGFSYISSTVSKKEETNLENFYINRFGKELYSMFFEDYTEKLWGRHPKEISADWGAQRVKGLSIIALIKNIFGSEKKETSLIEEFRYPKLGPGQLWELAAKEFVSLGGEIIFNAKAERLTVEENTVTRIEYIKNSQKASIDGDVFISSMPIKNLIGGMNACPQEVREVAQGLPYRDFVTVGLLVDKLRIKNKTKLKTVNNIIPDCWIYVQDKGVKLGRIQVFNNWSPYMVKDFQNKIFIGLEYFCTENDDFWNMDDEALKNFAETELVKIGVLERGRIEDYHVEKVKKAYPAYFDTYGEIDTVIKYLNSVNNLFCIGRNGQHRYNNMDHSMVTAFRTVDCILNGSTDKTSVWNVNTDKEYHEEKRNG